MKRDLDLVRQILIFLAENERGPNINWNIAIDGYAKDQVLHHAHLMEQGGLIVAADATTSCSLWPLAIPLSITWAGHDFLEASNKPGLWEMAKKNVIGPSGGIAFKVLLEWLERRATEALG